MKKKEVLKLYKGFPLIPLARNGKNPIVKNWKKLTVEELRNEIKMTNYEINYGLRCGEDSFAVVDFDVKDVEKGIDDKDLYKYIIDTCDKLEINYLVQTSRSGGKHIFFKHTGNLPGNKIKFYYQGKKTNTDFITNTQVLVYPSYYDGKKDEKKSLGEGLYEWDDGTEDLNEKLKNLSDFPSFLTQMLKESEEGKDGSKNENELNFDQKLIIQDLLMKFGNKEYDHNIKRDVIWSIRDAFQGSEFGYEMLFWWYKEILGEEKGAIDKIRGIYNQRTDGYQKTFRSIFPLMTKLELLTSEEAKKYRRKWNAWKIDEKLDEFPTLDGKAKLWNNDFDIGDFACLFKNGEYTGKELTLREAMLSIFRLRPGGGSDDIIYVKNRNERGEIWISNITWVSFLKSHKTPRYTTYIEVDNGEDKKGNSKTEIKEIWLLRDLEEHLEEFRVNGIPWIPQSPRIGSNLSANLFRGYKRVDLGNHDMEKVNVVRDHNIKIMGEINTKLFDLFFAHILQKPEDTENKVALILYGPQGCGKTKAISFHTEDLIGEEYTLTIPTLKKYHSPFNGDFARKLAIIVSELEGNKDTDKVEENQNDEKDDINHKTIQINDKFVKRYQIINYARRISSTNNLYSVRFGENDRRYVFITCDFPLQRKRNESDSQLRLRCKNDYYKDYFKSLTDDVKNNYFTYLLNMELEEISQNKDDLGFKRVREISKKPIEYYIDRSIENLEENEDLDPEFFQKTIFRNGFLTFMRSQNDQNFKMTDIAIREEMLNLGYGEISKNYYKEDGSRGKKAYWYKK